MDCDVIIVGGGPAGLAFARSVAGCGLEVVLVERQPAEKLARPRYDGREIALTHGSVSILKRLGVWERLPAEDVAPLVAARVIDGFSPFALEFDPEGEGQLGWLVSNHRIREALWQVTTGQPGLRTVTGAAVDYARTGAGAAEVLLSSGERLRAKLLVAADSRLSPVREHLGIAAEVNRLGRSMLVCRVQHEKPHAGVATEWFGRRQTLALLPLNGNQSSVALTLPEGEIARINAMADGALGEELTRRSAGRLGQMRVTSPRAAYPLITTWSRHFAAARAALIGDAAVGMHPVTAHGFNLGLSGQALLARLVADAVRGGRDPGSEGVLRSYEAGHRMAARPLYAATNMIVKLYTDERLAARAARGAALRIGARMPLFRSGVRAMLTAN
ncbi:5-demethoxyubiquinol-8 5-hydroxylase UbiM [Sphingomonas canadensis]|uniref:5-demethoxyubiquinol-8 5-hydroxylase UbiM n=1 Tax=Sphingomonas canadensis TaxID=1219257 RepID=A0ABW3HBR8_9SPHN|nr:5-demethoxyubiquinol-8 5-hydroxylase UbiM [Sphingomonas canadensis]MCW3837582.1 5-demethoxyubiquinol-8 5-hydroxylase UbiM [Sphingomonas canadensis]